MTSEAGSNVVIGMKIPTGAGGFCESRVGMETLPRTRPIPLRGGSEIGARRDLERFF
jgi:hypothetical protein